MRKGRIAVPRLQYCERDFRLFGVPIWGFSPAMVPAQQAKGTGKVIPEPFGVAEKMTGASTYAPNDGHW